MGATMESARTTTISLRIETVDNWHRRWGEVLFLIERLGHRGTLVIDSDGWLSARQVVLASFTPDEQSSPVGFIVFRIRPVPGSARTHHGRSEIDAVLASCGVEDLAVTGIAPAQTKRKLLEAARAKAKELGCHDLHESAEGSGQ